MHASGALKLLKTPTRFPDEPHFLASARIVSAQAGHFLVAGSLVPKLILPHFGQTGASARCGRPHDRQRIRSLPRRMPAAFGWAATATGLSDGSAMATSRPISGLRKNDRKKKPTPLRPFWLPTQPTIAQSGIHNINISIMPPPRLSVAGLRKPVKGGPIISSVGNPAPSWHFPGFANFQTKIEFQKMAVRQGSNAYAASNRETCAGSHGSLPCDDHRNSAGQGFSAL